MINAEVFGDWIKVQFKYNHLSGMQVVSALRSIPGHFYNPDTQLWGIPLPRREEFQEKLGKFLVVWTDDPHVGRDWDVSNTEPMIPYTFKVPPLPHQMEGFNVLTMYDRLLLADDPGLGKTFQVLTAMDAKVTLGHLKRVLVLTKATLTYNWYHEAKKFTDRKAVVLDGNRNQRYRAYSKIGSEDVTFYIMSYGTYRNDYHNLLNTAGFDALILDEGHRAKNPTSKIGTCIKNLPVRFKYFLSATPVINRPLEAYNMLCWFGLEHREYWRFRNHYAIMGGYNNKEIVGYQHLDELQGRIHELMLRRPASILGLKKVTEVVYVKPTTAQAKKYKELQEELKRVFEDGEWTGANPLTKLTKLRQCAISSLLIDPEGTDKEHSAKIEYIKEEIEDYVEDTKILLFTNYRGTIDILLNDPDIQKYNPAVVHGGISSLGKRDKEGNLLEISDRQKQADRFQNDPTCRLFIGTIEACAEGLTLTAGTRVYFIDEDYRETMNEQATGRALRIGTTETISEIRVRCAGTVDELIGDMLKEKAELFAAVIDGKPAAAAQVRTLVNEALNQRAA